MTDKKIVQQWYSHMWESGHSKEVIKREFYINFHDNDPSDLLKYMDPTLASKKKVLIAAVLLLVAAVALDIFLGLIMKLVFSADIIATMLRIPTFLILFLSVMGIYKILKKMSTGYSSMIWMSIITIFLINLPSIYGPAGEIDAIGINLTLPIPTYITTCVCLLVLILSLILKLKTNPDAKLFSYVESKQ